MNEINIKNEISELDLMKNNNTISKLINDSLEEINFTQEKMMLIICYLELKIKEEEKSEYKKDKLVDFYKTLKDEVISLSNSRLITSTPMPNERKMNISMRLKVSTNKLSEYGIYFSEPINSILALIVAQESLIRLE